MLNLRRKNASKWNGNKQNDFVMKYLWTLRLPLGYARKRKPEKNMLNQNQILKDTIRARVFSAIPPDTCSDASTAPYFYSRRRCDVNKQWVWSVLQNA